MRRAAVSLLRYSAQLAHQQAASTSTAVQVRRGAGGETPLALGGGGGGGGGGGTARPLAPLLQWLYAAPFCCAGSSMRGQQAVVRYQQP